MTSTNMNMNMNILIANNATALQAVNPDVSVEAEYGDAVVTGRVLTMAHHGPRAGAPAPCSYPNECAPGATTIGISHVDLDTVGGVMATLGRKPEAPGFWALAEFVDLNGAHKITLADPAAVDLRRVHAYWAFSQAHRVYAPRDGSVADVTDAVMAHVQAVEKILADDEDMLAAGDAFAADEDALNASTFLYMTDAGVIFRSSTRFANHLYTAPDGSVGRAVVTHNPGEDLSGGAITMSLADPVPGVNCGAILKGLFGPEAGGHAGIGGSPRGVPLSADEAERAVQTLSSRLADALSL